MFIAFAMQRVIRCAKSARCCLPPTPFTAPLRPLEKTGAPEHIGDYTLFFTGMYPESMHRWGQQQRDSFFQMVQAGKESYYIVSQFDLFEYAREAPFFARLSGSFETCIYGLNMVRGELDRLKAISPPRSGPTSGPSTQIM